MKTLVLFLLSLLSVPLNGWALSVLWRWFLVPAFGLPDLGIAQSSGIALVASFLTHQYHFLREEDRRDAHDTAIAYTIARPLLALAMGFIVKLFL